MSGCELTVVIPAWNEAARVAAGIQGYTELCSLLRLEGYVSFECVIVDDGSDDATATIAREAGGENVRVLGGPHRGKGGALRQGVLASLGHRIVVVDVDWSVAPGQVAELLKVEAGVVCACREGQGARRIAEPAWRHLLGRGFNWVVQHLVLAGVQDSQCGCKAFDRAVAMDLFSRLTIEGWAFDVEILTLAYAHGYTVREVPIVWRHEQESRVAPLPDGWAMLTDVLTIRRNLKSGAYFRR